MASKRKQSQELSGDPIKKMNTQEAVVESWFEDFKAGLDQYHNERETVIKASRDITSASKKIIFALQRIGDPSAPIPTKVSKDIDENEDKVQKAFQDLRPYLQGISAWRYRKQITGGIQEYIEAISFRHFLQNHTVITLSEVQNIVGSDFTTMGDYILGICDLSGELMRFAITHLGVGGQVSPFTILIRDTIRGLKSSLDMLIMGSQSSSGLAREIEKKKTVLNQSLGKVERAVYSQIVRGSERPKDWSPADLDCD